MKGFIAPLLAVIYISVLTGSAEAQTVITPEGQADFQKGSASATSATTTSECFTSGSPAGSGNDPQGLTFLKVCITDHGNVSFFESPAAKVHLNTREGYAVCSSEGDASVQGFDAGIAEAGWGLPTVSHPSGAGKLPLVVTRDSLNGKLQLKQTFTMNAAERQIQVAMALKNKSAAPLFLIVTRYFDGDIQNSATGDIYDSSSDSVWASQGLTGERDLGNGLMLIQSPAPSATLDSIFAVQSFSDWHPDGLTQDARRCFPTKLSVGPTAPGDFVGRSLTLLGSVKPGQTKTVTYKYRRF